MSVDQAIALIGVIVGALGVFYGIYKDRKIERQYSKKMVEAVYNDMVEIMKRGMGGQYIPGMSEKAGEQLKMKVRNALEKRLLQ